MKTNSIFILFAFILFACKKEKTPETPSETPTPTPTAETGTLKINFGHLWESENLVLQNKYAVGSDTIQPTMLKYYVSNISLKNSSGNTYKIPNSYHIINAENPTLSTINLTNIPKDTYIEISYLIGVDSLRNVSGSQSGALDPINGMFWTWSTGYIFFMIEANVLPSSTQLRHHNGGFKLPYNNIIQKSFTFNGETLNINKNAQPQINFDFDFKSYFTTPNQLSFVNDLNAMQPSKTQKMAENFSYALHFKSLFP
jgi:hypothetical protein